MKNEKRNRGPHRSIHERDFFLITSNIFCAGRRFWAWCKQYMRAAHINTKAMALMIHKHLVGKPHNVSQYKRPKEPGKIP